MWNLQKYHPPSPTGLHRLLNSLLLFCLVFHWELKEQTWSHLSNKRTRGSAAAESLQSCPTLCDPIDSSPPGSPILGILQAGTLEWVAISFSNAWKWKVKVKSLSRVQLFMTPWTAAYQAPLSMGFSRQEYWSGQILWNTAGSLHFGCLWRGP